MKLLTATISLIFCFALQSSEDEKYLEHANRQWLWNREKELRLMSQPHQEKYSTVSREEELDRIRFRTLHEYTWRNGHLFYQEKSQTK